MNILTTEFLDRAGKLYIDAHENGCPPACEAAVAAMEKAKIVRVALETAIDKLKEGASLPTVLIWVYSQALTLAQFGLQDQPVQADAPVHKTVAGGESLVRSLLEETIRSRMSVRTQVSPDLIAAVNGSAFLQSFFTQGIGRTIMGGLESGGNPADIQFALLLSLVDVGYELAKRQREIEELELMVGGMETK